MPCLTAALIQCKIFRAGGLRGHVLGGQEAAARETNAQREPGGEPKTATESDDDRDADATKTGEGRAGAVAACGTGSRSLSARHGKHAERRSAVADRSTTL
jgi:hypothetical protein